jgi:hypothetical protein
MKLYGGIDLHSNNCVVALLDEEDRVVYPKRLGNDLDSLLEPLAPYRAEVQGRVVESTFNGYWRVEGLQEVGYTVPLANTAALQPYTGLKHSDDGPDARGQAPLWRLGRLPEGYIYPKDERAVREFLRKRSSLARPRTSQVPSIENLVVRTRAAPGGVTRSSGSLGRRYRSGCRPRAWPWRLPAAGGWCRPLTTCLLLPLGGLGALEQRQA